MFKPVDSRQSFPEMEKRILQLWRCYRHPDPPKAEKGLGWWTLPSPDSSLCSE